MKRRLVALGAGLLFLSGCDEFAEPSVKAESVLLYEVKKLEDLTGDMHYIVDERTSCLYVYNGGSDATMQLVQWDAKQAVCGEYLIKRYFNQSN